jgi:hypothetical protein
MATPDLLFAAGLVAWMAGAVAGIATWRRPGTARVAAFSLAILGSLL